MRTPLHRLADHGQSVWIDFLFRQLLQDGELARLMREDAVSGVITRTLEEEGVQKFADSFEQLLSAITTKRRELALA
jgi:hypothetical protein